MSGKGTASAIPSGSLKQDVRIRRERIEQKSHGAEVDSFRRGPEPITCLHISEYLCFYAYLCSAPSIQEEGPICMLIVCSSSRSHAGINIPFLLHLCISGIASLV